MPNQTQKTALLRRDGKLRHPKRILRSTRLRQIGREYLRSIVEFNAGFERDYYPTTRE